MTRSSGRHRPPMVSVNGETYEGDVAAYVAQVAAELRRRDQSIARMSDELSLLKQALRDWQTDQARLPYVGELDIDPGT